LQHEQGRHADNPQNETLLQEQREQGQQQEGPQELSQRRRRKQPQPQPQRRLQEPSPPQTPPPQTHAEAANHPSQEQVNLVRQADEVNQPSAMQPPRKRRKVKKKAPELLPVLEPGMVWCNRNPECVRCRKPLAAGHKGKCKIRVGLRQDCVNTQFCGLVRGHGGPCNMSLAGAAAVAHSVLSTGPLTSAFDASVDDPIQVPQAVPSALEPNAMNSFAETSRDEDVASSIDGRPVSLEDSVSQEQSQAQPDSHSQAEPRAFDTTALDRVAPHSTTPNPPSRAPPSTISAAEAAAAAAAVATPELAMVTVAAEVSATRQTVTLPSVALADLRSPGSVPKPTWLNAVKTLTASLRQHGCARLLLSEHSEQDVSLLRLLKQHEGEAAAFFGGSDVEKQVFARKHDEAQPASCTAAALAASPAPCVGFSSSATKQCSLVRAGFSGAGQAWNWRPSLDGATATIDAPEGLAMRSEEAWVALDGVARTVFGAVCRGLQISSQTAAATLLDENPLQPNAVESMAASLLSTFEYEPDSGCTAESTVEAPQLCAPQSELGVLTLVRAGAGGGWGAQLQVRCCPPCVQQHGAAISGAEASERDWLQVGDLEAPCTLLVLSGETLAYVSGGVLPSTEHRVALSKTGENSDAGQQFSRNTYDGESRPCVSYRLHARPDAQVSRRSLLSSPAMPAAMPRQLMDREDEGDETTSVAALMQGWALKKLQNVLPSPMAKALSPKEPPPGVAAAAAAAGATEVVPAEACPRAEKAMGESAAGALSASGGTNLGKQPSASVLTAHDRLRVGVAAQKVAADQATVEPGSKCVDADEKAASDAAAPAPSADNRSPPAHAPSPAPQQLSELLDAGRNPGPSPILTLEDPLQNGGVVLNGTHAGSSAPDAADDTISPSLTEPSPSLTGTSPTLAGISPSPTAGRNVDQLSVFTEKFRAREKDQALSQTNKRPRLFLSPPGQQDLSADTTVNPARSAVMESPGSPREGPHGVSDQLSAARETARAERQSVDASWVRATHQADGDDR
jgi:hypothetical protein